MAEQTYFPEEIAHTDEPLEEEAQERGGLVTMEALERIIDQTNQKNADLIRSIVGERRGPLQPDAVAPEIELSFEGLPDPSFDQAGFMKGVAERAKQALGRHVQQVTQGAAQQVQQAMSDKEIRDEADRLVKQANPSLTDPIIAAAASQVVAKLRAEGKDPMTELRRDVEGIAQSVLDITDDWAAQLSGAERRSEPTGGGRTRGLVTPRGRAPTPPKRNARDVEDPQAFLKELQGIQKQGRIY